MFRSLLVTLDGSTFAEHALPLALSIARRAGAGLWVAQVHVPFALMYADSMSPFAYDSSQNLGRVPMTMAKPKAPIENLKYTVKSLGAGKGKLSLEWENHIASVPIAVK